MLYQNPPTFSIVAVILLHKRNYLRKAILKTIIRDIEPHILAVVDIQVYLKALHSTIHHITE